MITSASLEVALKKIFFDTSGDCRFVVPIRGGFFVPTIDRSQGHESTWIGYRILEIDPRTRLVKTSNNVSKQVRIAFRITAMGPLAETYITSTLLWEDRMDVKTEFEDKQAAQIMYERRRIYTQPVQQEGLADDMLWVTDMHAMSFIEQTLTTIPWFVN